MKIENNDIGKRIDKYLGETTDYTRSKIQKMIENGNILVNNNKVKKDALDCLSKEFKDSITGDYVIDTCVWEKQ